MSDQEDINTDQDRLSPPERQSLLLQIANDKGRVRVRDAALRFGVTSETVRKDLKLLQDRGLVMRVHGGGIPSDVLAFEPDVLVRTEWAEEKDRIAHAALAELPEGGVIFVEAGTTTQRFAEILPLDRQLTVVTNSLIIATRVAPQPSMSVIILGGRVRPVTMGSVDTLAVRNLRDLYVDVAFLGTNGASIERGLTTPDIAEAETKHAALHCSPKRVLLADHTKADRVSLYRYGNLSDCDVFITDTGLDEETAARFRARVPRLEIV